MLQGRYEFIISLVRTDLIIKKKGIVKVFNFSDKNKFAGKWEKNYITDFLFDKGIEFMTKHSSRAFVTMISIPDPVSEASFYCLQYRYLQNI